MKLKHKLYVGLVLGALSSVTYAKMLYVDPQGNDSVTYEANSATSPWRTIGRAAWGSTTRSAPNAGQAARAGDTVIVRAGTYSTTGTGDRIDPAYNPINSGSAGSPIVFQADGTVVLTQTGQGPLIGANGNSPAWSRNYITWRGPFTINEINARSTSDTGPVVLWSTIGSVIDGVVIDASGVTDLGNNHNGIRIENTRNVVLRNNRIVNVLNFGSLQMNGAGVMAYFSDGAVIENNEISNCGSGVFIKGGDNTNFVVRKNVIYGGGTGVIVQYTGQTGEHRIHQNLLRNNTSGIAVRLNAYNVKVVNNTLVDNSANGGIVLAHWQEPVANILVANNIVTQTSGDLVNGGEATNVSQFSLDRNVYFGTNRWSMAGSAYSSLSTWQAALGGCPLAGNDCAATVSNPMFVSASDYRLQSTSPARNVAVDLLDLNGNGSVSDVIPAGAYVTGLEVIGRGSSSGSSAPPPPPSAALAAPTGLRVVQ